MTGGWGFTWAQVGVRGARAGDCEGKVPHHSAFFSLGEFYFCRSRQGEDGPGPQIPMLRFCLKGKASDQSAEKVEETEKSGAG